MKYYKNDFFLIRILSAIAIISFLVISLSDSMIGLPDFIRPLYFLKGYVKLIFFIQNMFVFILFVMLVGIALYNINRIVIGCVRGEKKALYIVSLLVTIIYSILFYPYYDFTLIPMKMWYAINFFGCVYILIFILLIDRKIKHSTSIDNRVFSLDYTENKMHEYAKSKNIIFSRKEMSVMYILSFLIIAGFVFLDIRILYISRIFYDLYNTSFGNKHQYAFIITDPIYLCGWIIFICFMGLLYFSIKGLWKGSISYNLKKTIYIFPTFILVISVYLILYLQVHVSFHFTILIWHLIHLTGICFIIFMLYCYNNIFKRHSFSKYSFSVRKNVIFLSKREQKYIFIITVLASIFSLFYMIVHVIIILTGINVMMVFAEPYILLHLLWLVGYFAIIVLIYFNIKALIQVKEDKTRVNIRINLYITIFYLITYIPFNIFLLDNITWIIIGVSGTIFFFLSFYFFFFGKFRIVLSDVGIIKKEYKKEVTRIINTQDPLCMCNIIQEFRNEHKLVLDTISLIRKENSVVKKHEILFSMKKTLIKHLEKEKKYLYIPLQNASEHNKKLNETVETFVSNMEETTEYILSFYEKYEILTGAKGFLYDLDKFFKELFTRISSEEAIFFKEYEEYFKNSTSRTTPLENKIRYTRFERIFIKIVSLIVTIFFLILIRDIYNISSTSYIIRHNFSFPNNYYALVIFVCLIILLYFLAKGFYLGFKYNLPKRSFYFIILSTVLVFYILLYWPGFVGPLISRIGWNIIHLIGIILVFFIVSYTKNRNEKFKVKSTKIKVGEKTNYRFSEKDIKYLYVLTVLCVILYFSFIIIDIFGVFNLLDYTYLYTYLSLLNPYFDALIICYCTTIILFLYTIKGVFIGIKKKLQKTFIFRLFFLIIILILYFPTTFTELSPLYWILIDTVSLSYFVSYLMYVSMND